MLLVSFILPSRMLRTFYREIQLFADIEGFEALQYNVASNG
jgi:hypothetical protein